MNFSKIKEAWTEREDELGLWEDLTEENKVEFAFHLGHNVARFSDTIKCWD